VNLDFRPIETSPCLDADLHLLSVAGLIIETFFAYHILDTVQKWTELLDEFFLAISGHNYLPQQLIMFFSAVGSNNYSIQDSCIN